jgi:ATP-dependent DNA helicase RecQ
MPSPDLSALLKTYFGFDSFRPLQREIVEEVMAGRDAFALLPTGGGKSLCFQLPALALPKLTVVVSPLIALMKDQVDSLRAAGIAATYLNSSLAPGEARERLRGLHRGEYKLLYLAPERLMLSGVLDDLKSWGLSLLAVDEAHCISEWGHDFRPEYRQIASLRELFPGVPVLALTATATPRVRDDIARQLGLGAAQTFVASFNRPNLTYRVEGRRGAYDQLSAFIAPRKGESGIIYCQSRKGAEGLAEKLNRDGVAARPYHAGLNPEERARNQELFLRDEVKVVCATIAFGMGINKPNVRYVVHYDLPKNVEGYYQETGRAGRDGLPAECLLLFSAGDMVKQSQFIEEKGDPDEQRLAREQLRQMVHYAEANTCRRALLLDYFGEQWPEPGCRACDNCLTPRAEYDGTLAAQKFLSCIYRVRQAGGFGVGLNHIVEVLTGADTEKIRRWNHDKVSTYGIGKEMARGEWQEIGRQLIRLGLVRQTTDKFSILKLAPEGGAALRDRRAISLTKPIAAPVAARSRSSEGGAIACDEALFEKLRRLRKRLADERDVPAYVVFSDVTLRLMARDQPTDLETMGTVSGVGEKKRAEYGETFAAAIREHLAELAG